MTQWPGDGFYPFNLNRSKVSYRRAGAECHNAPNRGLASDNAKGNKDIQKGMQKTAGAKGKAK